MNDELSKEIERLVQGGDERALRRIFVDRFTKFDQDEQEAIFTSLFAEALEDQAAEIGIEPLQQRAIETATKLMALRDVLAMQEEAQSRESGNNAQ